MRGLAGKTVAVTGGASGIGESTVQRLAEEGSRIAILDRNGERARDIAKKLTSNGNDVVAIAVDIADEAEVEAAFESVTRHFGKLDAVVAGAGIFLPDQDARVDALDRQVWDTILGVNLTGTFLTCKHGIRAIQKTAKTGTVVCVSSPTGTYGLSPQTSAYASSKAGIVGMVRTMAIGYAPDIRVNVVMPGVVLTPIVPDPEQLKPFLKVIPLRRAARSEEIASVIAFLTSDDSSFMTGSVVYSDGGVTAGTPPPSAD